MSKITTLRRYQRKGVYLLKRFDGRALLADEMGLGKSIQALKFMFDKQAYPTIIVCPASLKWNWENEVNHHFGLQATVLEGQKPPRVNRRALHKPDIVIINYDILVYWSHWLMSLDPRLLIFDEAHYCANRNSKRSKAVKKLAAKIEYVIGLTGTPLVNRPAELWPILNIIRPDLYQHFRPFADRYCAPTYTPWGWQFKGATNLDHLHRRGKETLMIRRLKKKVLKDLPKNSQIMVPVDLKEHKRYEEAEVDFINWVSREKGIAVANRVKKAEELSKWNYLKQLSAELKLPFVIEWIDNFLKSSESKLVVFGTHKAVLGPIYNHFKKTAVLIDGSVRGRIRQQRVDAIQKNPRYRVCVGNIVAAGVGLNLTTPDTALFAEIPWTPAAINQCIGRIDRIGQENETTAYFTVAKGTVEEKLYRIVHRKQKVFDAAIDGKGSADGDNIYAALLKEMMK